MQIYRHIVLIDPRINDRITDDLLRTFQDDLAAIKGIIENRAVGSWTEPNLVSNVIAALRLRTDAARRYKRVDRAIAVIWKMLMVAEKRFRRLQAPELMNDVYLGVKYVDGVVIEAPAERIAA